MTTSASVTARMPGEEKTTIGRRLERLREERKLTQREAGAMIDVGERQWQRWETGVNIPRPETLRRIALSFGVSVEGFHMEEEPELGQLDRIEAQMSVLGEELQRVREQLRKLAETRSRELDGFKRSRQREPLRDRRVGTQDDDGQDRSKQGESGH